jgi:RNA polymerase sigma-B factor
MTTRPHPHDDAPDTAEAFRRIAIAPCLRVLPEREQRILYLRFFDDMTQSQIAEIMGISQMHVSRLISRICAALRAQALSEA